MEIPHEASLLIKVALSAAIVLGLTFIAERVSTRIAGLLSGAPLTAVLVYFFVGRDLGTEYVVESIPHSISSFTGTIIFVLTYYWVSARLERFSVWGGLGLGVVVYFLVAALLHEIPFTMTSATVLSLSAITLSSRLLRKIRIVRVARPIRLTATQLLLRGGLAALLISIVISLAETVGSHWTGLLVGFPATLLPTYLIIHLTYGKASTHAMVRNFPTGVASLIIYIWLVPFTFPALGVYGGTAACLAASLVYLSCIMFLGRIRLGPASRSAPPPSAPLDPP